MSDQLMLRPLSTRTRTAPNRPGAWLDCYEYRYYCSVLAIPPKHETKEPIETRFNLLETSGMLDVIWNHLNLRVHILISSCYQQRS